MLRVRSKGLACGPERVLKEIESVLAPKHLSVEHIAWRTDNLGLDSVPGVLLVLGFDLLALSLSHKFCARKVHGISNRNQRRVDREILVLFPEGCERTAQKRIGIMPCSSHRDNKPV